MKNKLFVIILFTAACALWAQNVQNSVSPNNPIPLKKVVILTSGLSYFEHSDSVNGSVNFNLPFRLNAVNDALKTLVINDPLSANPSVTYQAENTLVQTLRSLRIDLSDNPDIAVILARLKGAEAGIVSSRTFIGRIAGVEYRNANVNFSVVSEPWILLNTDEGLISLNFKDVSSIKFIDKEIENDLNRALDLILSSRNSSSRLLNVNLPVSGANARRNVMLSYVIPSPVWKVSYRLDLGTDKPLLQGWAIVDNDSDTDWRDVELSLVSGRPASFIQELYPPYYVSRPVQPLSIAGTASASVHDRGVELSSPVPAASPATVNDGRMMRMSVMAESEEMSKSYDSAAVASGAVQTAAGSAAGGQFEFTIKNPVTLDRRMSAMFPLVEIFIDAKKTLIYNGSGRYPRLGAEITNTSGMKLPAGPITVYDKVYSGDALIEFWNEGEKRLISFGEDLSVTASGSSANTRVVSSVKITGGVMSINRNLTYIRTYTFLNSSAAAKQLVVEHAKTSNTELISPKVSEQTASAYRFNVSLNANKETVLEVSEQRPISETVALLPLRLDSLLSYSTNQEIPENVRRAFVRAAELRRALDTAETAARDIETQRTRVIADQDRIRKNLEAAGSQTQQGQEYLRRLSALDNEIDKLASDLDKANANTRAARSALDNYLNGLNI